MKCPKCNKENLSDSNFCRFCSNPLKEKCSECGEMEKIGRPVCEKRIKEISDEFKAYRKKMEDKYFILRHAVEIIAALLLVCFIATVIASRYLDLVAFLVFTGCSWGLYFLYLWRLFSKSWEIYDKSRNEFYKLHPDYLDLIKKADKFRERNVER